MLAAEKRKFFSIILICTLSLLINSCSSHEEDEKFYQFFKNVYSNGEEVSGPVAAQWPSPMPACIAGNPSELSKRRLVDLFSFIRLVNGLNIEPKFNEKFTDCSKNALMFIRFHSGEANVLEKITQDIAHLLYLRGIENAKDVTLSKFGMSWILAETGHEPALYVAIDQFDRRETEYDQIAANNVIQQEIIQGLLFAADLQRTAGSPNQSIIEETHSDIDRGDEGLEPRYRKEWSENNVVNICVYDVMLLSLIYSSEARDGEGNLKFYRTYIYDNFQRMKREATEKLHDRRFSEIFPKEC